MKCKVLLLLLWLGPGVIMARASLTHREVMVVIVQMSQESSKTHKAVLLKQINSNDLTKEVSIKNDLEGSEQVTSQLAEQDYTLLDRAKNEQPAYKRDSSTGKYSSAIEHLKRYKILEDSIFKVSTTSKLYELRLKYKTEKQDKNTKLVNSAKNKTLGGAILPAIILVLLISLYLSKIITNRKLKVKQLELDQKNTYLEVVKSDRDKLLKEKEWLMKEVHHRVKNNLQLVTSLLFSQSVYLEDRASILAIKDSMRRMQAISLIHQKLYQDESASTIDMAEYFRELVHYLSESFEAGHQIVFEQNIEQLDLDVSQAIPLGLIVTESTVNAIKYAFLNGQKGIVRISLRQESAEYLLLEVSDNGSGLPEGIEIAERHSLGLNLMQGLAKQLNGNFKIENDNGVHVTIRFRTYVNSFETEDMLTKN